MKNQLSSQQISHYQNNGYLVIEGFLDAEELEVWRRTTDEAVRQRTESKGMLTNIEAGDYYSKVFTQCIRLADTHDGMHALMFDPRLSEVAGTLSGVEGLRLWHDQALIKEPWGNPTAWHLDDPYWSFDSPNAISLWMALDNATLQNGCMYYLPGTHKTARYQTSGIGANMRDLFKEYPEWINLEAVAAPCPAGSAVFHSGLIAHGAGANMTPGRRRAMTCGYMPEGCTFNGKRNILPEEYFNSLKVGDVLDNNEWNPLVWKKSAK